MWVGYVRDWDRTLRAGNYPATTRYNYLLAVVQLARYLDGHRADLDAEAAAVDPAAVRRAHLESFQAWMVQTRSPSTAMNKYKALQQFFRWLVQDEEVRGGNPLAANGIKLMHVGAAAPPVCPVCTPTAGGTPSPTSGNSPAATPAT